MTIPNLTREPEPDLERSKPVNELPIAFPNSVSAPNETIRLPSDVTAHWDMLTWAKSRGGQFAADRWGPMWVAGGGVSLGNTVNDFVVDACEGWPLEEVIQQERVGLRVLSAQTTISNIKTSSLLALTLTRDTGLIAAYPISLPSLERSATFMEVSNLANVVVPLAAVMFDPAQGGQGYATIHDLRTPPFGVVYEDRNTNYVTGDMAEVIPYDIVGGWAILRDHRLWFYAPIDSVFEVTGTMVHARPYDPLGGSSLGSIDVNPHNVLIPANSSDLELERKASFFINGQIASSVDKASGVEVLSGLAEATTAPSQHNPVIITVVQPLMVRTVFKSLANQIVDVCLASFIAPGQHVSYESHIRQPQIWARMLNGQPQFPIGNQDLAGFA